MANLNTNLFIFGDSVLKEGLKNTNATKVSKEKSLMACIRKRFLFLSLEQSYGNIAK